MIKLCYTGREVSNSSLFELGSLITAFLRTIKPHQLPSPCAGDFFQYNTQATERAHP
tara:strand:+ start:3375 stop:3545 length:171 start_codon:yes stop_codon:yes gene_type:complete